MSQAAAGRAYTRELIIAMAAYVLAVIITVKLTPDVDGMLRAPFVLIPLISSAFALRAYLRFLGRLDELGRRIQLEAQAIGFGALENGKYDPRLPLAFKIAVLFGARIEDVFDPR